MVWGAIIQAGAALLSANQQRKNAKRNRKQAKNQIQYTVADAKKAGIHPLAALGGGSPSPVISTNEPSTAGSVLQSVAGSIQRIGAKRRDQELFLLQTNESKSRTTANQASAARDFALASKAASDARRNDTSLLSRKTTGTEANPNPFWQYVKDADGTIRRVIGKEAGQAYEDILPAALSAYGDSRYQITNTIKKGAKFLRPVKPGKRLQRVQARKARQRQLKRKSNRR